MLFAMVLLSMPALATVSTSAYLRTLETFSTLLLEQSVSISLNGRHSDSGVAHCTTSFAVRVPLFLQSSSTEHCDSSTYIHCILLYASSDVVQCLIMTVTVLTYALLTLLVVLLLCVCVCVQASGREQYYC
jgi:hypothetical protein